MTTVVDFQVPARDTVLGTVLETVPSVVCEVEQLVASDGYGLWVVGENQSAIESALESDPSVATQSLLGASDDRWLYEVTFADDAVDVFDVITEEDGAVLTAAAADGQWQIRTRFVDRETVSHVYDRLTEHDRGVDLVRLSDRDEYAPTNYRLTPKQYETLVAALDHGYFTIPRETSMQELADELGVSHQALSERLRRAFSALVTTELDGVENPGVAPAVGD